MLVIGDAKCLHCGHVTGRWTGEKGTAITVAGLQEIAGAGGANDLVRCRRCRGPVFLDDASPIRSSYRIQRINRMRQQLASPDGADDGQAA